MNIAHALERLMLTKLIRDYCGKHGVEYSPRLDVAYRRVGEHVMKNINNDNWALCQRCANCEGESCKLS